MTNEELETIVKNLEKQVIELKNDIEYFRHLDAVDKGQLFDYGDEKPNKFIEGEKVKYGIHIGLIEEKPTKEREFYKVGFDDGDVLLIKEDELEPYTEPRWTFTDDEKVILRKLPEDYKWIVRNNDGFLRVCDNKPYKSGECWTIHVGASSSMFVFSNHFQSIKWTDDEPCEFRKYI